MYPETAYEAHLSEDYLDPEPQIRTSDIQLNPIINGLLLAVWATIVLIGFGVIFLAKSPIAGAVIIGLPTFIGMVVKPTFALCVMMLVLPTGAGIGYRQDFSLDRGVGIALALSFLLNIIVTRPRLRLGTKALWVLVLYTIWVLFALVGAVYFSFELTRAFTAVQLLALTLIVYWIIETNSERTFLWALRSYLIGTLGTILLATVTGATIRAAQDTPEARYAATVGDAINANVLAGLTVMAFLASIYLLARDKSLLWRILYLVGIVVLPMMLLRIGSRGALIALAFTLLSPLLFLRQVMRRPGLAVLLLAAIILGSLSARFLVRSRGLETQVASRLTDIGRAKEAIDYRMQPVKKAVEAATRSPTGTSFYGWFEKTGLLILPHSDFFLVLGVYGIPGAILFAVFLIMLIRIVMRTPLGIEKLYTRAVLTYLLVIGLNNAFIYQKFYWVFLALVIAGERIAILYARPQEQLHASELEHAYDLPPVTGPGGVAAAGYA